MLSIRPANAQDFDAVAALTNHFIVHTSIHFGTEPVTAAELRASWEKSAGVYPYLVAESEGRFAGYAKAGVWRERAAYRWTPEAGIYVEEWTRGKGVGTALYRALLNELTARGFESVIGGITLPNDASVRLHERCGFVKVGHVARAGWKFGAWHDVGFWQAMLGRGAAKGEN
jgi:L-amino acid N-acyltransferase YncA